MKTGETTGFTKARKGWLYQALQETSGNYPIYISCGDEEQLSSSWVNYFIQEVTGTVASSPIYTNFSLLPRGQRNGRSDLQDMCHEEEMMALG